jgi:hypothetical protein
MIAPNILDNMRSSIQFVTAQISYRYFDHVIPFLFRKYRANGMQFEAARHINKLYGNEDDRNKLAQLHYSILALPSPL